MGAAACRKLQFNSALYERSAGPTRLGAAHHGPGSTGGGILAAPPGPRPKATSKQRLHHWSGRLRTAHGSLRSSLRPKHGKTTPRQQPWRSWPALRHQLQEPQLWHL